MAGGRAVGAVEAVEAVGGMPGWWCGGGSVACSGQWERPLHFLAHLETKWLAPPGGVVESISHGIHEVELATSLLVYLYVY